MSHLARVPILLLIGPMMTAAAPPPLTGIWSGDRATLTLTADGGSFREDCALATFDAPAHRTVAGFEALGRREDQGHGGPQLADVPPKFQKLRLTGKMDGEAIALTVAVEGGAPATYRLLPGRRVKHIGCY